MFLLSPYVLDFQEKNSVFSGHCFRNLVEGFELSLIVPDFRVFCFYEGVFFVRVAALGCIKLFIGSRVHHLQDLEGLQLVGVLAGEDQLPSELTHHLLEPRSMLFFAVFSPEPAVLSDAHHSFSFALGSSLLNSRPHKSRTQALIMSISSVFHLFSEFVPGMSLHVRPIALFVLLVEE